MADEKRVSERAAIGGRHESEEVAAIPLVEERLLVTKRQVESGRVRVRVTVEEQEQTVTEQLLRDELQIERVPRNIRVTEVPHVRLEGNTTIIPVVEEVVVVEKALVLVEEIHICRRSVSEEAQIPVTLRVERANVETEPGEQPASAVE
jgi:uncharacterized protein (TIGR02271 family)